MAVKIRVYESTNIQGVSEGKVNILGSVVSAIVRKKSARTYRVIQKESALLWEMIVWVILSKKVHTNMGPILNGYRVMGIF